MKRFNEIPDDVKQRLLYCLHIRDLCQFINQQVMNPQMPFEYFSRVVSDLEELVDVLTPNSNE